MNKTSEFEKILNNPLIEEKFFEVFEKNLDEIAKEQSVIIYNNRQERRLEITQDSKRFNINYSNKLEELKNGKFDESRIHRSANTLSGRVGEILGRARRTEQETQREEQTAQREEQEEKRNSRTYETTGGNYRFSTQQILSIRGVERGGVGGLRQRNEYVRDPREGLSQHLREDPILLPLNEIAERAGYSLKREKTSRNHIAMQNSNGDSIVITRRSNGHYLYYNPLIAEDRGNVYNFCKNRHIDLKSILAGQNFSDNHLPTTTESSNQDKQYAQAFKNFSKASEHNSILLNRGIDKKFIKEYALKEDLKGNLCFPLFILEKQNEKENIVPCGYVAKLKTPIFVRDGVKLDKPIKALNYGKKGVEILKPNAIKYIKDIQTIVITESSLDSLAYAQLHKLDMSKTLLCATGGQISEQTSKVLNFIINRGENAQVILGFDNDESGKKFKDKMLQTLETKNIKTQEPVYKDFCDDLAMFKLIQYKQFELLDYEQNKHQLKDLVSDKLTNTLKTLNNENISEDSFHRENKLLQSILKIHKPNSMQMKFLEFVKENSISLGVEKEM